MRNPALPSNVNLDAAGDNGITLTKEQHRILTSQSEGSTTLYSVREHQQQVEGTEPYLGMTDEECNTLNVAHMHFNSRQGSREQMPTLGKKG